MSTYANPNDFGAGRSTATRTTVTGVSHEHDRVHWGPVLAGIFVTLSILATLGVIGSAVGFSAYDPGDRANNYGLGAGIWGILSVLIAFFVGGWTASGTSARQRTNDGLINGALVWAVTIPLLIYLIAGVVGHVARTTAGAAAAGSNAALHATEDAGQNPAAGVTDAARTASASLSNPDNQNAAASTAARSAWSTVAVLLLSLGASVAGGYVNARREDATDGNTAVA